MKDNSMFSFLDLSKVLGESGKSTRKNPVLSL